jgi:prolipoprotein diacylglyceryl transferase
VIGYIPSPSSNSLNIGPLQLHFYGLIIAIGVLVAAWLTQRRWAKLGGFAGTIVPIGFWAVVAGLIGARLYSVATSWQQDTGGNFVQIFEIWNGGLSIWGGVSGGVLGGWLRARYMRVPLPALLDVAAPALALAQAIGRWGNYFNQELFGLPSKLPWAVRITNQAQLASINPAKYRPPLNAAGRYLSGTFQPTFLYESLWDLVVFGLLLLIERRLKLRRGYLFAAYAGLYSLGRFWTEYLRIDPAHRYLGLRLNDWTSVAVFVVACALLLVKGRPKPADALVGDQLPPDLLAAERSRAAKANRQPEPADAADAVAPTLVQAGQPEADPAEVPAGPAEVPAGPAEVPAGPAEVVLEAEMPTPTDEEAIPPPTDEEAVPAPAQVEPTAAAIETPPEQPGTDEAKTETPPVELATETPPDEPEAEETQSEGAHGSP